VSNYDRERPGATAAGSLKSMAAGNYSAYFPALEAAESVGDKVVQKFLRTGMSMRSKFRMCREAFRLNAVP
jgi:hypothetical protein